jgi:ribokinase
MAVLVFGSINMDLVVRTPRLPRPGETLTGQDFFTAPGGKGANQAVASARLGPPTSIVGRVGEDVFGEALRASLSDSGVSAAAVAACAGPSGVAVIAVDDAAENTIVVVPGANGLVGAEDVARLEALLEGARVLLLQLEVPLEAVLAAALAARARGTTVVLDPAPVQPLSPALYTAIDIITPNESEAAALVGFALASEADIARAAQELVARGAGQAIIKLGGRGAYWSDGRSGRLVPAFPVTPVDTVAAGDAFNGALSAALSEGRSIDEALRWGMAAGAIAVTRPGAQQAMPTRAELLAFLEAR